MSKSMIRIAVDAMGGDNAPGEIVAGALESLGLLEKNDRVILVGPKQKIIETIGSVGCHSKVNVAGTGFVIGGTGVAPANTGV